MRSSTLRIHPASLVLLAGIAGCDVAVDETARDPDRTPAYGAGDVDLAARRTSIRVRAAGVLVDGVGPILSVRVDGAIIGDVEVHATAPQDYVFETTGVTPGARLDLAFTNPTTATRTSQRENRRLVIDEVVVNGHAMPFGGARFDVGTGAAATDEIAVRPIVAGQPGVVDGGAFRFVLSSGLSAPQLGLVINDDDPYSVAIGEYYRVARGVPEANIVHVQLPVTNTITLAELAPVKTKVEASLPSYVQALALAWEKPWAVANPGDGYENAITAAISFGYRSNVFESSPYLGSPAELPFTTHGFRPAMLLAAPSVGDAEALIDRGVTSDHGRPTGSAYLMETSDTVRNFRARFFPDALLGHAISPAVDVQRVQADFVQQPDILFYFQGLAQVPNIGGANVYLPGAIADNLTSYGGRLDDPFGQTSILDFIAAGATGSFGTVSEPFALEAKFVDARIVLTRYVRGQSMIESMWKSVGSPAQGLFVGEPLANPWQTLVPPADTVPPTTPVSAFAYVSTPTTIQLGWYASFDDVAVAGYRVYRDGVLRMTLPPEVPGTPGTFPVDDAVVAGTSYTYTFTAFDGAGNESAPTPPIVVVAGGAGPQPI